jgi:hypothetical protein
VQALVTPLRTWMLQAICTLLSIGTGDSARTSALRSPISSKLPGTESMRPLPLTLITETSSEHQLRSKNKLLNHNFSGASTIPKGSREVGGSSAPFYHTRRSCHARTTSQSCKWLTEAEFDVYDRIQRVRPNTAGSRPLTRSSSDPYRNSSVSYRSSPPPER